ncbi:MAG: ion channel [Ignavibacteriaceae bacterium]
MNLFSNISTKFLTTSNSFVLLLVIFTIFIIPLFPIEWHRILYSIFFALIFLLSALALSKYRVMIFNLAMIIVLIEWISVFLNLSIISTISFLANILFFILLVILFIQQIAKADKVTPQVIMESINGYLMLGMSFSILVGLTCAIDPTSFSFAHLKEGLDTSVSYVSSYFYYGFVTLTTLRYGDLVPLTPAARSLSIFTGITGQMYAAITIALLVSKYLSQRSEK